MTKLKLLAILIALSIVSCKTVPYCGKTTRCTISKQGIVCKEEDQCE